MRFSHPAALPTWGQPNAHQRAPIDKLLKNHGRCRSRHNGEHNKRTALEYKGFLPTFISLRREGRVVSGFTCMPLCIACANVQHSGPRVPAGTRPSLRPRHHERATNDAKLGQNVPRECEGVSAVGRIELGRGALMPALRQLRRHSSPTSSWTSERRSRTQYPPPAFARTARGTGVRLERPRKGERNLPRSGPPARRRLRRPNLPQARGANP